MNYLAKLVMIFMLSVYRMKFNMFEKEEVTKIYLREYIVILRLLDIVILTNS